MPPRTCPDCEFAMDEATHETTHRGNELRVDTDGRRNLQGRYGREVQAYVCPGCGLVRLYAE